MCPPAGDHDHRAVLLADFGDQPMAPAAAQHSLTNIATHAAAHHMPSGLVLEPFRNAKAGSPDLMLRYRDPQGRSCSTFLDLQVAPNAVSAAARATGDEHDVAMEQMEATWALQKHYRTVGSMEMARVVGCGMVEALNLYSSKPPNEAHEVVRVLKVGAAAARMCLCVHACMCWGGRKALGHDPRVGHF